MKILVCGGRHYSDEEKVRVTLAKLFADHDERILIHGGAPGADSLAGSVARAMGATVRVYQAEWAKFGRRAGPMRNQRMLDAEREGLDWVVAFPGGSGTRDLVNRARKALLKVLVTR